MMGRSVWIIPLLILMLSEATSGAATGGTTFSSELIAIVVIIVIILIVLLFILLICCCRDWFEKMCPCLIMKVGPEYDEKWHYVDRYGETNLKFVSYNLGDYRAKKLDKQRLVDSDKSGSKIAVHVPLFEEKLHGTVSMKPVLISSMDSTKPHKPRKSKTKRSRKQKYAEEIPQDHGPKALPPLPERLRADTLMMTTSPPQRTELSVTYEIPVERSDTVFRPPSAFRKKRPTRDEIPYDEFVGTSTTPRTTPRSRITLEDDQDYR